VSISAHKSGVATVLQGGLAGRSLLKAMKKHRGRLIKILVILSIVPITMIPLGNYADRMGLCLRESWVASMVIATILLALIALAIMIACELEGRSSI